MPDQNPTEPGKAFQGGPAAETDVSLSQALLAPLDAIFKAQLHAARSFLNMLLQLGYPHRPVDEEGVAPPPPTPGAVPGAEVAAPSGSPEKGAAADRQKPYMMEFHSEILINGQVRRQKVAVPALALVPLAPLAVESAEFKFGMTVRQIDRHRQIQKSEEKAVKPEEEKGFNRHQRPWFLVDDPISVRGTLGSAESTHRGAPTENTESGRESTIQIEVKVGRIMMPAGLEKLVTSLTQNSYIADVGSTTLKE
ncbi:MAG: DUF2589 domain-containing protein [Candidatus Manganitrophaceae bacterium]